MNQTPTCPDCKQPMERGFIPDIGHSHTVQTVWHPGEAEESSFLGLRVSDRSVKTDPKAWRLITTFRCPECGLLRSYAE